MLPSCCSVGDNSHNATANDRDEASRDEDLFPVRSREKSRDGRQQHQGRADDDRTGAISLADLQHRRGNIDVFLKVLVGRSGEQQQECHHQKHAEGVEPLAGRPGARPSRTS